MKKRNLTRIILLMHFAILCFSCTKEERSEVIREEVLKNDSVIIETTNNNQEVFKYIINKRSGKVHNFSHGMSCGMSERNKIETNDDIEEILKNENYDVCLTCKAGLKLNLDKYKPKNKNTNDDEVDLSNKEVNLIKLYMNMYEFGKLDTETQKFLICIFEVGSWYVNNVYTQLGGQKNVAEIEEMARASASNAAYNKWRNYLDDEYYNKYELRNDKKILPTLYDYKRKKYSDMVVYRCDLFKDAGYGKGNIDDTKEHMQTIKNPESEEIFKEYKNYCVIDDSSKFAAAVYYHYINKEVLKDEDLENKTAYDIDLWDTNSTEFSYTNKFTNKILKSEKFEIISIDIVEGENNKKENLQIGDLLYRRGNVEFYIGKNKVVNWGRIQKYYTINKEIRKKGNKFYSYNNEDKGQPYIAIIRFLGGKKNEE